MTDLKTKTLKWGIKLPVDRFAAFSYVRNQINAIDYEQLFINQYRAAINELIYTSRCVQEKNKCLTAAKLMDGISDIDSFEYWFSTNIMKPIKFEIFETSTSSFIVIDQQDIFDMFDSSKKILSETEGFAYSYVCWPSFNPSKELKEKLKAIKSYSNYVFKGV